MLILMLVNVDIGPMNTEILGIRAVNINTQYNVLIQSAQAMLAQANTQPQQVLSLLQ